MMIFGQLITENSGGFIMKKSSLYFIYGLLFIIIGNTAEDRLVIGVAIICAVLNIIASLVLSYVEDKDKYN